MQTVISSVDQNMVFTGHSSTIAVNAPVPRGWVAVQVPPEDGIWQWQSTRWVRLDEYPTPPAPLPTVPEYDKVKILEGMIALGQVELFAQRLASADIKTQLRYGAYPTWKADDPDFVRMMTEIQAATGMTDEQAAQFLGNCLA